MKTYSFKWDEINMCMECPLEADNVCGLLMDIVDIATKPENCPLKESEVVYCKWDYVNYGDYYKTKCGNEHKISIFNYHFTQDGTVGNDYRYCPYCGREIESEEK